MPFTSSEELGIDGSETGRDQSYSAQARGQGFLCSNMAGGTGDVGRMGLTARPDELESGLCVILSKLPLL